MKIAIVYPRTTIDTVPSLMAAIDRLTDHGYGVEVFAHQQAGQPTPTFSSPQAHLHLLGVDGLMEQSTTGLRRVGRTTKYLPAVARAPLRRVYNAVGAGVAGGTRLAVRARMTILQRDRLFAAVIGVDPDGLLIAAGMAHGAPLVYYSLELLLSDEVSSPREAQLKQRERELSRRAAMVIVQDEARARLLAEDNGLSLDRIVLVPNAPSGPARRRPTRYWHERLDLPAEARVVLHSGSLGDWTGIEDIVASAANWPEPWVLVIHTRYDAETSSYAAALRSRSKPGKVYFSLTPVPRDEYDPLIDGADIGVAFYVPIEGSPFTQRNVQTIGLSSGKLAYYLRAGLPVIVNRAASIGEVVESQRLGVSVDDAAGIPAALGRVTGDYDRYSSAALAFFDNHLNFGSAFDEVICRLDALICRQV